MNRRVIAFAVMLALATLAAPAAVPALEFDPAPGAIAGPPCLIGSDPDCKIKIVCVREPCEPERIP